MSDNFETKLPEKDQHGMAGTARGKYAGTQTEDNLKAAFAG